MYRDFSETSKRKLLSLVASVENEKICDFTDWVGDRWLDFQSWIGKLNIKNYINKVNEYHKKVIDKNNATKKSIEKIFRNVATVDSSYKKTTSQTKSLLNNWNNYINQMAQIVAPQNGLFDGQYMTKAFDKLINEINALKKDLNGTLFDSDGFQNFDEIDILQRFLDARNTTKDAVLFGLSRGLTEGVKSLINKSFGKDDINDKAYKASIIAVINNIVEYDLDLEFEKEALSAIKSINSTCKDYNDFCELMRKNKETTKYLKMIDNKSYEKIGKLISYGTKGVETVEIIFTDYSKTIAALEKMRNGLIAVNGDQKTIDYCNELIDEYNNKFSKVVDIVWDTAVDKSIDGGLDVITNISTGGLFGIANTAHDFIWDISGVTSDGDALASIYASSNYSYSLIEAYNFYADKLKNGDYTDDDIENCKMMFELSKTSKLEELKNIKRLTKKEYHEEIDFQIEKLENMTWNTIDSHSSFGGGGGMGFR